MTTPSSSKRIRPRMRGTIVAELRRRIEERAYPGRLPGIEVLAKEFDVNRKTVNLALLALVREGLLIRRRGHGTFPVSSEALPPSVIRSRINSRRYAVLIKMGVNTYPDMIHQIVGCESVIREIGGTLLIVNFDDSNPEAALGLLRDQRLEGLMVTCPLEGSMLQALTREFTTVLVDVVYPGQDIAHNAVLWDYMESSYRLGQCLAANGTRRVCLLQGTGFSAAWDDQPEQPRLRLAGLERACRESGMALDTWLVPWNYQALAPGHPLDRALRDAPDQTALMSYMPQAVINRLHCHDLMGRLRISGFASRDTLFDNPPGHYIVHDHLELGVAAGRMLTDNLGRPSNRIRIEVIPAAIESV